MSKPVTSNHASLMAGWARRDFEAKRTLNAAWRFMSGDMGGGGLTKIFPKGRSRHPAGRAIILVLGYPNLRSAAMRSAVTGWVENGSHMISLVPSPRNGFCIVQYPSEEISSGYVGLLFVTGRPKRFFAELNNQLFHSGFDQFVGTHGYSPRCNYRLYRSCERNGDAKSR